MSIPFQDSETAKNLLRAFAGESQARNRYDFAALWVPKNHVVWYNFFNQKNVNKILTFFRRRRYGHHCAFSGPQRYCRL